MINYLSVIAIKNPNTIIYNPIAIYNPPLCINAILALCKVLFEINKIVTPSIKISIEIETPS